MIGGRRRARILVLQALYEIDSTGHTEETVLSHIFENSNLSEENINFARELIAGIIQNTKAIDEKIKRFAPAFPIEQIAVIDRNILRLAIFEILLDNKVPVKAAINEAVELAKSFGSDSSPRFVNGVLGSVSSIVTR
ncbi:MAG: transcription antitermination factor NusB [Chloroflexota bacterium]